MKCFSLIAGVVLIFSTVCAQVKVSEQGGQPDASAVFELESSTMGFLPPRLTVQERNAIQNPADGLVIFNVTSGCLNYRLAGIWMDVCGTLPVGSVTSLDCNGIEVTGSLAQGAPASGVSFSLPYSGGNGGAYGSLSISSTGVTGLQATIEAGSFSAGSGTLLFSVSGTPQQLGLANFAVSIGGHSCSLSLDVQFACGASAVDFTYRNISVSYATVERNYGGAVGTRCWMDRNLGALQVALSSGDVNAFGDLFQWGRGADGHQDRSSSTTNSLSGSDQPGNSNFIVVSSNPPRDWRSPQNNSLWQGVSGINNPCPAGWRLPTEAEFVAEKDSWSTPNAAGAIGSPLKWPMAGYRIDITGGVSNTGIRGLYWSGTVSGTSSRALDFGGGGVSMLTAGGRADGFSVRCIKD
jgi:hypothetical protein